MNTLYWDGDILYTLLNLANLEDGFFFWGLEVWFWFGPLFPWVQWVCEVLMGPQQCCVSHRINTCDLSIQVTVFKSLLIGKASVISWDVFHLWWRPSNILMNLFFFIIIIYFWPGQAHGPTVTILWIYDAGFCGKMTTGNPGTSSERKRKMEKLTHFLKLLKSYIYWSERIEVKIESNYFCFHIYLYVQFWPLKKHQDYNCQFYCYVCTYLCSKVFSETVI